MRLNNSRDFLYTRSKYTKIDHLMLTNIECKNCKMGKMISTLNPERPGEFELRHFLSGFIHSF